MHRTPSLTGRRTASLAAAALLALGVAACSDDDSDSGAQSTGAAGSSAAPATSEPPLAAGTTPPNDPGTPRISADRTQDLKDGDEITVSVHSLDPEKGYYGAICSAERTDGPPSCTGGREDQAWLVGESSPDAQRATGHIAADGSAEFTLTARAKGDSVDCTTDDCELMVFGDHNNGFTLWDQAPVNFA
jgi:hypothetical protein